MLPPIALATCAAPGCAPASLSHGVRAAATTTLPVVKLSHKLHLTLLSSPRPGQIVHARARAAQRAPSCQRGLCALVLGAATQATITVVPSSRSSAVARRQASSPAANKRGTLPRCVRDCARGCARGQTGCSRTLAATLAKGAYIYMDRQPGRARAEQALLERTPT